MKEYRKLVPREKNTQNKDMFLTYRSNSVFHYKDLTGHNYENRVRLNPKGEIKRLDVRGQIPLSHIHDYFFKYDVSSDKTSHIKNAYENADINSKINSYAKTQKHQKLLENDKNINKLCKNKRKEIKQVFENKKNKLKIELTRIIKDALKHSKKNNPVRAMLPENINEIIDKAKKQTQDLSMTLNISHISKISRISSLGGISTLQKNIFLNLLGVDVENLNSNNINIDIDKCWNFIKRLAKGRKVEDILRYKVVNEIMSVTEKKSAEKAKKIYDKLDIYKKYMSDKKFKEFRQKQIEEERKQNEIKANAKEYIKLKMRNSVCNPKMFNEDSKKENIKIEYKSNTKRTAKKRRMRKSQSEILPDKKKNVVRLDAYKDVAKIIDFIDKSKDNSQSKICRGHFTNIQMAKALDKSVNNILGKNDNIYK